MREQLDDLPQILEDEDIHGTARQFPGWEIELIHLGRGPLRNCSVVIPLGSTNVVLVKVRRAAVLRVISSGSDYSLLSNSTPSSPPRVSAQPLVGGVCLMLGRCSKTEIYLPRDCCAFVLSMACSIVREAIGSRTSGSLPTDEHAELRSLSAEHSTLLTDCMDLMESLRRSNTPNIVAPQVQRRLQELIASAAGNLFTDPHQVPSESQGKTLRRRAVALACAYIDSHSRRQITLDDLCAAAGVRARTLEYGFKESYDVGPMAYLRSVRLCRVRRDLLTVRAASTSVAKTARRWSFTHMGQFSRDYRLMFGESPSSTLARGRSRSLLLGPEPGSSERRRKLNVV